MVNFFDWESTGLKPNLRTNDRPNPTIYHLSGGKSSTPSAPTIYHHSNGKSSDLACDLYCKRRREVSKEERKEQEGSSKRRTSGAEAPCKVGNLHKVWSHSLCTWYCLPAVTMFMAVTVTCENSTNYCHHFKRIWQHFFGSLHTRATFETFKYNYACPCPRTKKEEKTRQLYVRLFHFYPFDPTSEHS